MRTPIVLLSYVAVLGAVSPGFCASEKIEALLGLKRLSIQELTTLAEAGNAPAKSELGARYGRGAGVPTDYARAIDLLRQAAAKNDPDAQYYLGTAFSNGTGVPRDNTQATLWYELAANQHQPAAEYVMAELIGNGKMGIAPSPNAAVYYLWDSAAQGYEPAEALLGYVFQTGAWTDPNPRAAAYWYRRALSKGPDQKAVAGLRSLLKTGVVDIMPDDPPLDASVPDPGPEPQKEL